MFRNREIGVDRLGHIQAGVRVDDELDVEVANGPAAIGPCRSGQGRQRAANPTRTDRAFDRFTVLSSPSLPLGLSRRTGQDSSRREWICPCRRPAQP